jgi:uncharacterized protein (TIGR00730 family)
MIKSICVYASSSDEVPSEFIPAAQEFGRIIAEKGITLVFGGANVGLMYHVAKTVKEYNGKVIGVIPQILYDRELAFTNADQIKVTKGMRERKAEMEKLSDAFVAFPGGFGTLEELMEILTLKQLHYHSKPIIIFNDQNHYQHLLELFEDFYSREFAKEKARVMYYVAQTVSEIFEYLETYIPVVIEDKWFTNQKPK